MAQLSKKLPARLGKAVLLLAITALGIALQGYHPGAEDDGVYLSAIKHELSPSLYPFNTLFFTVQVRATLFDECIVAATRATHLPLAWVELLGQFLATALLLFACWKLASLCFTNLRVKLAATLTVACVLSMSIAGTALYISDEHLHPRLLASDASLLAIYAGCRGRWASAVLLLLASLAFHPIMSLFGVSFCLLVFLRQRLPELLGAWRLEAARLFVAMPGGWMLRPARPEWEHSLDQSPYLRLDHWLWYEWIGALAPPLIFLWLAKLGRERNNPPLAFIASTAALFSGLQLLLALVLIPPLGPTRLEPLQPMRYLHLTFVLLFVLGGGALGEYILKRSAARWALVFLPLAALNGYAQRLRYPATVNLELPGNTPRNRWTAAFDWVRVHTPENAVFALDPHYLDLPGEDHHSFRALAERSSLTDDLKDGAVVTQVPELATDWLAQQRAQSGWEHFTRTEFARLARTTPARWAIVAPGQESGLDCPYTNATVSVCRLPVD